MSCIIREGPLEQVTGRPASEEGQDADKEPRSGKSFQENKRTSDSCRLPIGVVGLFVCQDTCCCPFFPINSCQFFHVQIQGGFVLRSGRKSHTEDLLKPVLLNL